MISYKQQALDDHWDAIVIGSGIGGLTAAALLSKYASRKVLVLERHYTAGGYTHSFRRPGYSWDVGVHYVGDLQDPASPLRAAFDNLTDGKLEWAPMPDVYDRILMGGRTFEFPTGLECLRVRLKDYFPSEAAAIDGYLAAVRSAEKWSRLYFTEKAIPRFVAWLAGPFMRAPFLHWASHSTLDVLHRLTRNPELIAVLTAQWGDYGLPPAQSSFGIHAIIASHYFHGASYPIGGAARIAESIAPLIERNGGKIVVSADVQEIIVQGGKATGVKMADGREFHAGVIVSDAGARNTFERLVCQPQPILKDLERVPGSLAHLSLYVGVKQSARDLRHLGIADHRAGRLDTARKYLEESSRLWREIGRLPGVALNLVGLTYIAAAQGRRDDAMALIEEARTIAEATGAHGIMRHIEVARSQL